MHGQAAIAGLCSHFVGGVKLIPVCVEVTVCVFLDIGKSPKPVPKASCHLPYSWVLNETVKPKTFSPYLYIELAVGPVVYVREWTKTHKRKTSN